MQCELLQLQSSTSIDVWKKVQGPLRHSITF